MRQYLLDSAPLAAYLNGRQAGAAPSLPRPSPPGTGTTMVLDVPGLLGLHAKVEKLLGLAALIFLKGIRIV